MGSTSESPLATGVSYEKGYWGPPAAAGDFSGNRPPARQRSPKRKGQFVDLLFLFKN